MLPTACAASVLPQGISKAGRDVTLACRYARKVDTINRLEGTVQTWSDADLTAYSAHLRERCRGGETLDSLLPEAFALVREACQRKLGKRHFDVQLLGGMALHDGVIAEMGTGEGKSLTGVLPAYLNALTGETVFVATVNDYLAKRDADVFRPVFAMLNMQARSRSRFVGAGRSWRGRSDACAPRWTHRTWTVLGSAVTGSCRSPALPETPPSSSATSPTSQRRRSASRF